MKLRKGKFNIAIKDGPSPDKLVDTEEVSGLVSDMFGIHKGWGGKYFVIHLLSGYHLFSFPHQKQARDFVSGCEQAVFPVPFDKYDKDKGPGQYRENLDRVWDIRDSVVNKTHE